MSTPLKNSCNSSLWYWCKDSSRPPHFEPFSICEYFLMSIYQSILQKNLTYPEQQLLTSHRQAEKLQETSQHQKCQIQFYNNVVPLLALVSEGGRMAMQPATTTGKVLLGLNICRFCCKIEQFLLVSVRRYKSSKIIISHLTTLIFRSF